LRGRGKSTAGASVPHIVAGPLPKRALDHPWKAESRKQPLALKAPPAFATNRACPDRRHGRRKRKQNAQPRRDRPWSPVFQKQPPSTAVLPPLSSAARPPRRRDHGRPAACRLPPRRWPKLLHRREPRVPASRREQVSPRGCPPPVQRKLHEGAPPGGAGGGCRGLPPDHGPKQPPPRDLKGAQARGPIALCERRGSERTDVGSRPPRPGWKALESPTGG